MVGDFALPAALAGTLPGLLAWLAARRYGLAGLMGALAVCGLLAIVGWNLSQDVLTGDDAAGIFDAVADYLTGKGWTVERESIPGGAHGYTDPEGRRVVLDSDLSPAQAAKTGLHEAAHVILHAEEDHAEYVEHRGTKETEAESVAYVVAGILGLDTSAYSVGYVAGWSNCDAETIKATAANVLRAAHALADALTEQPETVAA